MSAKNSPVATIRQTADVIRASIPKGGLQNPESDTNSTGAVWRISPEPFPLSPTTVASLESLGNDLLAFYRAANRLYIDGTRGNAPDWVTNYLNLGKNDRVQDLGRLRRYRTSLPSVIRPDLMALEDGRLVATELDSVPGGFGALAGLTRAYHDLGYELVGGNDGIPRGFAAALQDIAGIEDPSVAIVVSSESADYRSEMEVLASLLQQSGLRSHQVHPSMLRLHDERLQAQTSDGWLNLDLVYRFFELHDLPNIPKIDLLIYAVKHRIVSITAPLKAYLEEKMLLALFHHPELHEFWNHALGTEVYSRLQQTIPQTWIVDPQPIPPGATINPPLISGGQQIHRWNDLLGLSQKKRRLVLKASGFSELAWGSRGVTIGHDVPQSDWDAAVHTALNSYRVTPHVLQEYHQSRRVDVSYFDFDANEVRSLQARTRICPYYTVADGEAKLSGVLVTAVPSSSKIIHGSPVAVMMPATISQSAVI